MTAYDGLYYCNNMGTSFVGSEFEESAWEIPEPMELYHKIKNRIGKKKFLPKSVEPVIREKQFLREVLWDFLALALSSTSGFISNLKDKTYPQNFANNTTLRGIYNGTSDRNNV